MNTYASRSHSLIAVLLLAVLLGYYLLMRPALTGPFLFDDFTNLEHLSLLGNAPWHNMGDYLAAYIGNPGRPLAALSFLINDNAWPSDPYSFKFTNVLIHLLNGVLLFGLLRQLAKAAPKLPQHVFWPLLAMSAWLLHPMQISSQMLVVQRMTLLAGTFSFIGLWAYIALLQRAQSWRGSFFALAALGISTILAFLCKESGALLPLFVLVLNATLLRDLFNSKDSASKKLLTAGCAIPALAVMVLLIQMGLAPNAYFHREFSLSDRLFTQAHVLTDYLREIVFPSLNGGGIYHDDYPIAHSLFKPLSTLFLILGIFISIVWALVHRKKYSLASFAILWFFAGHLMESSILPLELYFEHRNYLPLLGPVLALTTVPFFMGERKKIGFFFLGIWLAALAAISSLQAPIWGQTAKLVIFWTLEHPKSLRATQELAKFYYDTADPQAAVDVMMYAYEKEGIRSADLPLTSLLTTCWVPGTKHKNVELLAESKKAIVNSPFSNGSLVVLQKLNVDVQNDRCPKVLDRQSWWALSDALLTNPKFRRAGGDFIHIERAKLFATERNLDAAMTEFEAAYAIRPNTELSYKIAEILITAGLLDEAEVWLRKGLALKKPWFKEMLSSDKEKSKTLLDLIERSKTKS